MRRRRGSYSNLDNGASDSTQSFKTENCNLSSVELDDIQPLATDAQICISTSVILLAIYTATLHPSVPGGDSGELIVSAYELGVAHPPGYPLFTMLSKFAMTVIPFRSPAWRVNFLNAVLSCGAAGFLQLTVMKLTSSVGSGLMAVGLFSVCRLTWIWSVSGEVFGLNNLFIALLMYLTVSLDSVDYSHPTQLIKKFYWLAFACGLALCNQHTIIVYVLPIALWAALKILRVQGLRHVSVLIKGVSCGLIGLSPYLYLPLSSYINVARWTWGDQTSLSGFLTHLARAEYGTFDLGKDQQGSGFLNMLNAYLNHVQSNMCELGPWLALIGLVAAISNLAQHRHFATLLFAVMTSLYTALFAWRANLDISNPLFKGVVERFWMQSDMGVAVLAAIGYHTAVRMVTEKFLGLAKVSMSSVFTTMGAGILIALQIKNNYSFCNNSSNLVVRDFAKTILEHLPLNAIVLTKGDLPSNSMRYLHLCEHLRRDLQLLDVEIMSYGWSLPKLKKFYPRIKFPGDAWGLNNGVSDGRRTFDIKTFIDANYERYPMYVCIGMQDRDPSWKSRYTLWPSGVCHRIMSVDEPFDPKHWANVTGGFADKWTHPSGSFNAKSWERVANDEMWHAKISTAFFMYKQADLVENTELKGQLLVHAYELYFRAIKLNQRPSKMSHVETFPSFWHKNFALSCERLLHVDDVGGLDKIKLCKLSIYHFQQYVHLTPQDTDNVNINNAISILQQRLNTFDKLTKVDKTLEKTLKRAEQLEEITKHAETLKAKQSGL